MYDSNFGTVAPGPVVVVGCIACKLWAAVPPYLALTVQSLSIVYLAAQSVLSQL
jgi:hypothetical protein